jgi:peptidyl-prolyl cis-trans isomerase C
MLASASASVFAQEAQPQAPAQGLTSIVVNGVTIPPIYADFVRQSRMNRGQSPDSIRNEDIRNALINTELLAQEATKKGLDKGSTLQAVLAFQRMDALSQAAIQDFMKSNPIPENIVKSEYDRLKVAAGTQEYRARHILVAEEAKAKELIKTLKTNKKMTFAELAKKHSKDPSAQSGGDLGWNIPGNYVREFAQALVKLGKGEMTEAPVKSPFGWHVIKLDDQRVFQFPEFDKLKNRIAQQIQQNNVNGYIQKLREGAKIVQ